MLYILRPLLVELWRLPYPISCLINGLELTIKLLKPKTYVFSLILWIIEKPPENYKSRRHLRFLLFQGGGAFVSPAFFIFRWQRLHFAVITFWPPPLTTRPWPLAPAHRVAPFGPASGTFSPFNFALGSFCCLVWIIRPLHIHASNNRPGTNTKKLWKEKAPPSLLVKARHLLHLLLGGGRGVAREGRHKNQLPFVFSHKTKKKIKRNSQKVETEEQRQQ